MTCLTLRKFDQHVPLKMKKKIKFANISINNTCSFIVAAKERKMSKLKLRIIKRKEDKRKCNGKRNVKEVEQVHSFKLTS